MDTGVVGVIGEGRSDGVESSRSPFPGNALQRGATHAGVGQVLGRVMHVDAEVERDSYWFDRDVGATVGSSTPRTCRCTRCSERLPTRSVGTDTSHDREGSHGDRSRSDDYGQPALLVTIARLEFIQTPTFRPILANVTVIGLGFALLTAIAIAIVAAGQRTDRTHSVFTEMSGAVASSRRARVVDAILLGLGALIASLAAVVLAAQYRPVLFRHDTSFIGSSLALLAPLGVLAGWRAGRRAARSGASPSQVALRYGTAVVALAALSAGAAVVAYRLRDGIGWPRLHLGVLIIVAGGSTALAARFGGLAKRWPRPIGWTASAVLALGALIGQVVLALGLTNEFVDRVADQCVERRGVRYCHFEGYRPFVDEWAPVVEAVLAAAPPPATRLTVRQTVEGVRPAAAGVAPKLEWSPGDTAPYALALDTANWVTRAVPVPETAFQPRFDLQEFEARGMVVLWLAAQANARTCAAFRFSKTHPSGGEAVAGNEYVDVPVPGDREQSLYAAALLEDPDARRKVAASWAALVDPATTLEQAAQLLLIEPATDYGGLCR